MWLHGHLVCFDRGVRASVSSRKLSKDDPGRDRGRSIGVIGMGAGRIASTRPLDCKASLP